MKKITAPIVSIVIALQLCACSISPGGKTSDQPAYDYLSLNGCKRAELHFTGTAKGHRRLGNYKVTIESRTKPLVWNQVIEQTEHKTQGGGSVYRTTDHVTVDGIQIGSSGFGQGPGVALAGGGAPPAVIDRAFHITKFRMNSLITLQDLVREQKATVPFSRTVTHKPINTPAGPAVITNVYTIKPNAAAMTVAGKVIQVSLFSETKYDAGKLTQTNEAYVSDSIPGRVVKEVVQQYFDNGMPAARTELTLRRWSVK